MPPELVDLIAQLARASWLPYTKQLNKCDAVRTQTDRCQHCWQTLDATSYARPTRVLTCGHEIHVDCAHRRAKRGRTKRCPRCNHLGNMASRLDDPLPMTVMQSAFWQSCTPVVETLVPYGARGTLTMARPICRLPPALTLRGLYKLANRLNIVRLIAFGPPEHGPPPRLHIQHTTQTLGSYYGFCYSVTTYNTSYHVIVIQVKIKGVRI